MNAPYRFCLVCSLAVVSLPGISSAAESKSAEAADPAPATNTIPQSTFVIPATPKDGKDPFFPDSTRPYANSIAATPKATTPTKINTTAFVLNGLSGTADRRLAMINGRTLAEGEESEISTPTGRITIRCVEIKSDSVIIEIGNERRELHLRSN